MYSLNLLVAIASSMLPKFEKQASRHGQRQSDARADSRVAVM